MVLLKGQERVGDRIDWTPKGRRKGRRVQDMSRVISRVHFIIRFCPDISPLLIRSQNRHGCCNSRQGKGGLVTAHGGGRTAVKIAGFRSTVRCCNHGRAVAPRCVSGFNRVPTQSMAFQVINVFVVKRKKQLSRQCSSVIMPDVIFWASRRFLPQRLFALRVLWQRTCRSKTNVWDKTPSCCGSEIKKHDSLMFYMNLKVRCCKFSQNPLIIR